MLREMDIVTEPHRVYCDRHVFDGQEGFCQLLSETKAALSGCAVETVSCCGVGSPGGMSLPASACLQISATAAGSTAQPTSAAGPNVGATTAGSTALAVGGAEGVVKISRASSVSGCSAPRMVSKISTLLSYEAAS